MYIIYKIYKFHTYVDRETESFRADIIGAHHNWEIEVHFPFKDHLESVPITQAILVIKA